MSRRKRQRRAAQELSAKAQMGQFDNHPFAALASKKNAKDTKNTNINNDLTNSKSSRIQPAEPAAKDLDDASIFLAAMSDVQGLADKKKHRAPSKIAPQVPEIPSEDEEALIVLSELVSGQAEFDISDSDEHVEGRSEGLDPRILKKLRKGAYAIEAHLDLHGLVRAEAKIALQNFITNKQRDGLRCILIVHGRGLHSKDQQPVLKEAVVNWLGRSALRKQVLAFCTARSYDGGSGAMYVLLRKGKL